ncbi:MAG: hypothetical protein QXS69_03225 [Candidatus Aenigmatarchaeota archaeon]
MKKKKIELIDKFYEELKKKEGYFKKFEEMLEILDSLFSVESRKRAQEFQRYHLNFRYPKKQNRLFSKRDRSLCF